MIDPNKVMDDAQHLLKKAVNVLEEEIAAGILAAKKMEKKVIDVDEVRDTNPEDLMSRIRRDTHDAIDILLDAFTALTRHFGGLADTLNKANSTAAQQGKGNAQSTASSQTNTSGQPGGSGRTTGGQPNGNGQSNGNGQPKSTSRRAAPQPNPAPGPTVIRADKPAKPGTTIEIPMSLTNDSKDQPITIKLSRSELIGASGSKIGARNIKLTPPSFTLEPLQKKEVVVKISIPESCKEGVYSGLIQDDSNPDIKVIISIQIGKTKK